MEYQTVQEKEFAEFYNQSNSDNYEDYLKSLDDVDKYLIRNGWSLL